MKYALMAAILGAILISAVAAPALAKAPDYTDVLKFKVRPMHSQGTIAYAVATGGEIPKRADDYINNQLVFGYAWLKKPTFTATDTLSTRPIIKAVVATIHPSFTDSRFSPGEKWHAHTATLVEVHGVGLCLASIQSPSFKLAINGNELVEVLKKSSRAIYSADAATSFILVPNPSCPNVEVPINGVLTILNLQVVAPAP
jgi:hypothetical protein